MVFKNSQFPKISWQMSQEYAFSPYNSGRINILSDLEGACNIWSFHSGKDSSQSLLSCDIV
jgi:hypothetical protein